MDEMRVEMRPGIDRDARVRLVATARRVRGFVTSEATMTITIGGVSIVGRDATVLREALAIEQTTDQRDLPIVWRNGSAAVLLHEAVGHAAEHEAKPVRWPSWLRVADLPGFAVDDTGATARGANLMNEPPACLRRESFRDVPLRRMTNVHVKKHGRPPFQLPRRFIDVYLVAGGAYDPLTDVVTIDVAVSTAGAFTLRRTRAEVAESIAGATGVELRYPGVICSREGQELVVGSYAPVMITQ